MHVRRAFLLNFKRTEHFPKCAYKAGETVPARKVTKRKRPKDEWTSDDEGTESDLKTSSDCHYDSYGELMATGTSEIPNLGWRILRVNLLWDFTSTLS